MRKAVFQTLTLEKMQYMWTWSYLDGKEILSCKVHTAALCVSVSKGNTEVEVEEGGCF